MTPFTILYHRHRAFPDGRKSGKTKKLRLIMEITPEQGHRWVMEQPQDRHFMNLALGCAHTAREQLEVPVGALLVLNDEPIASASNCVEQRQDATLHAEMMTLQQAMHTLGRWRLTQTTLYTTLEPCIMCFGALMLARVQRIVWAADDLRHGACGSWIDLTKVRHPTHCIELTRHVLRERSEELMRSFFQSLRKESSKRRSPPEN